MTTMTWNRTRAALTGALTGALVVLALATAAPAQTSDAATEGATEGAAGSARPIPEAQAAALACFGALDNGTTWGQCLGVLFADCAEQEVGSEDHLLCLLGQRKAWLATIESQQAQLIARLTPQGATELSQLMSQWYGYVATKCAEIGAAKAQTGSEVAQVGCEITEMAGVVAELKACGEGRSTAPYCIVQE